MAASAQPGEQSGIEKLRLLRPRPRPRRLVPIAAILSIGMFAAACGNGSTATTSTAAAGAGRTAVVNLSHSSMGTILTTKTGLTLYYYTADTPTKIACAGSCAQTWPPLRYKGSGTPTGGKGVTGLGTIKRPDGGVQITYKGKPLYTFASDTPGQTTGQGVGGFQVVIVGGATASGSSTTTTRGGY